jgi:peroxiredoxin
MRLRKETMTGEIQPAPPARRRIRPVVIFVVAAFILGIGVAALVFPPDAKIEPAEPIPVGLQVGQLAPDFTLNTLDDGHVALSDLAGRPVLINFWASWCVPCRSEMPELVRAYETHKSEGFIVLGLNVTSMDSPPDVQEFVDEFSVAFPVLLDKDGEVSLRIYRIPGIPTSIFLHRDGSIARVQVGGMTGDQIDEFVAEILQ